MADGECPLSDLLSAGCLLMWDRDQYPLLCTGATQLCAGVLGLEWTDKSGCWVSLSLHERSVVQRCLSDCTWRSLIAEDPDGGS